MLRENKSRAFKNGKVYSLLTEDGYPIEVTDTFLPFYTKDAIGAKQNILHDYDVANRTERWMIGVSCMSGCPVGCKFCATGQLPKWKPLSTEEIVEQVMFILEKNPEYSPANAKEFKINYTRMGEPFLNIEAVKKAIEIIDGKFPDVTTIFLLSALQVVISHGLKATLHSRFRFILLMKNIVIGLFPTKGK